MKRLFTLLLLIVFFSSAFGQQKTITKSKNQLSYTVIDSPNKTFGFDILQNGKLIIHQPNIPSISGNTGFKTKDDAIKIAELMIKKIQKGEMPPAVTQEEMKKLKITGIP